MVVGQSTTHSLICLPLCCGRLDACSEHALQGTFLSVRQADIGIRWFVEYESESRDPVQPQSLIVSDSAHDGLRSLR